MKLYDIIQKLRGQAALLYDLGMSKKMKPEEISPKIEPIKKMLEETIHKAPYHELAHSIKKFENQIKSFEADISFAGQKILDCRDQMDTLKKLIKNKLTHDNIDNVSDEGYHISNVGGNITVR